MKRAKEINLDFIKGRRTELGFSMDYMAKELGFKSASSYYKREVGENKIDAVMLPALATILKCDIKKFFR